MTEDEAPTDEDVRGIARMEMASMSDARNRLMDEHSASFRWLIASLFAANGGALITLGTSELIPPEARIWACGWFTAGIISALLTAWLNQKLIQRGLAPMVALIAFWGCIAHGLDFDEKKHNELIAGLQSALKRSWPVQMSGWFSAILFIFGVAAAGSGYYGEIVSRKLHPTVQQFTTQPAPSSCVPLSRKASK